MIKSISQTLIRNSLIRSARKPARNLVIKMSPSRCVSNDTSFASNYRIKFKTIHTTPDPNHLVWVDCEMTGLDLAKDRLLEIAMIITDNDLNEIDRLGPLVLQCDERSLSSMDDWCKKTHGESGLTAKALKSDLTVEMIDDLFVKKLNQHSIKGAVLAGNSIGFDNLFIRKYLHKTADLLHYRTLDVSSIKILRQRWYPNMKAMEKELKHEALADILESIKELKYYREHLFK